MSTRRTPACGLERGKKLLSASISVRRIAWHFQESKASPRSPRRQAQSSNEQPAHAQEVKAAKSNQPPVPRLDLQKQAQQLKPPDAKSQAGNPQQQSLLSPRNQAAPRSTAPAVAKTEDVPKATARSQPPLPTKQMVAQAQNLKPTGKTSQPPLPSAKQVYI